MTYALVFPSLLCGLVLCYEDLRSRMVPRLWVALGCCAQLAVLVGAACITHDVELAFGPPLYGIAATVIQLMLSHAVRGSLGLGDVTASALAGQAVGVFGLEVFLLWWLAMGLIGLLWTLAWTATQHGNLHVANAGRHRSSARHSKIPFVPVIVASAVMAVALEPLFL